MSKTKTRQTAAPVSTAITNGKPKVEEPKPKQADFRKKGQPESILGFPVGQPDAGHCPRAINTRLTRRQGAALKAVFCQLRDDHATCEMEGMSDRGKVIEEYSHAVRWLLDRVADDWEQADGGKLLDVEGLVF